MRERKKNKNRFMYEQTKGWRTTTKCMKMMRLMIIKCDHNCESTGAGVGVGDGRR